MLQSNRRRREKKERHGQIDEANDDLRRSFRPSRSLIASFLRLLSTKFQRLVRHIRDYFSLSLSLSFEQESESRISYDCLLIHKKSSQTKFQMQIIVSKKNALSFLAKQKINK